MTNDAPTKDEVDKAKEQLSWVNEMYYCGNRVPPDVDACRKLLAHIAAQSEKIAELERLHPKEMKGRAILFEECEVGHGELRGENWVKNDCPWCKIAALEVENKRLRGSLQNFVDMCETAVPIDLIRDISGACVDAKETLAQTGEK